MCLIGRGEEEEEEEEFQVQHSEKNATWYKANFPLWQFFRNCSSFFFSFFTIALIIIFIFPWNLLPGKKYYGEKVGVKFFFFRFFPSRSCQGERVFFPRERRGKVTDGLMAQEKKLSLSLHLDKKRWQNTFLRVNAPITDTYSSGSPGQVQQRRSRNAIRKGKVVIIFFNCLSFICTLFCTLRHQDLNIIISNYPSCRHRRRCSSLRASHKKRERGREGERRHGIQKSKTFFFFSYSFWCCRQLASTFFGGKKTEGGGAGGIVSMLQCCREEGEEEKGIDLLLLSSSSSSSPLCGKKPTTTHFQKRRRRRRRRRQQQLRNR